jgi:hypothetical protein
MHLPRQSVRLAMLLIVTVLAVAACTVQLVAPSNSELLQKATSMQEEVVAWDSKMRRGAGTVADDPRHPEVAATIDKWRGEADAMLTLAASNDPGIANCSETVKTVLGAIESNVPADLRAATAAAGNDGDTTGASGCETALVAGIGTGIDDVEKALKNCRLPWVTDAYFAGLAQNPATASDPPQAPDAAAQKTLSNQCLAELKIAPALANLPGAQHGRAVSALLTSLEAIVYVETRKKAAETPK